MVYSENDKNILQHWILQYKSVFHTVADERKKKNLKGEENDWNCVYHNIVTIYFHSPMKVCSMFGSKNKMSSQRYSYVEPELKNTVKLNETCTMMKKMHLSDTAKIQGDPKFTPPPRAKIESFFDKLTNTFSNTTYSKIIWRFLYNFDQFKSPFCGLCENLYFDPFLGLKTP